MGRKRRRKNRKVTKEVSVFGTHIGNCHFGNIEVFTDKESGVRIFAGGKSRGVEVDKNNLIIDVGVSAISEVSINGLNGNGKHLEDYQATIIKIAWSDFEVPTLGVEFWHDLIKTIRLVGKDVVVACEGGHGRTGTTISILAYMMGAVRTDPIKFIRKVYCDEAVETTTQINYIRNITGANIRSKSPYGDLDEYLRRYGYYQGHIKYYNSYGNLVTEEEDLDDEWESSMYLDDDYKKINDECKRG